MTNKTRIASSLLCAIMFACSAEKEPVNRVKFEQAPDISTKLQEADFYWIDKTLETDACAFLGSLRTDVHSEKTFQMYQNIYAENGKFFGSHSISKLPQIRFMLSSEGSEDGQPMYRSYDRYSFYKVAKSSLCPIIPTYCLALNKFDDEKTNIDQTEKELAETQSKINLLERELNSARSQLDHDTAHGISMELTQKRVYRDHLITELSRSQMEAVTFEEQLEIAARNQRKGATDEQLSALKNLEDLQTAIAYWDSWSSGFLGVKEKFTSARNQEIEKNINTRIPGALDGQDGPLIKSDLFGMYLKYLNLAIPGEDQAGLILKLAIDIDVLRPYLTSELTLMPTFDKTQSLSSWADFERDVANSILLISEKPTGIQDATCKFVLSQRLIAQLISMKGIRRTAKLTESGFLEPLSKDPNHLVSHVDIPGIFNMVIDEEWLRKAILSPGQESPLPVGTIDNNTRTVIPPEYFSWVRSLAHVVSSANEHFWIKNKAAPLAEELLPSDLLKLSFGMMAMGLGALEVHFVKIHPTSIELIPSDTAEGYEKLVHTTIESLRSFDSQYKMHQEIPELAFLSDDQLGSIRPNGDKKVMLHKLLYASNKGAILFYKNPSTPANLKERLKSAVNRSGAYLKNEPLYQFGAVNTAGN